MINDVDISRMWGGRSERRVEGAVSFTLNRELRAGSWRRYHQS